MTKREEYLYQLAQRYYQNNEKEFANAVTFMISHGVDQACSIYLQFRDRLRRDDQVAKKYTSITTTLNPNVIDDITTERQRQIEEENHHPAGDDLYTNNQLVTGAISLLEHDLTNYVVSYIKPNNTEYRVPARWPWGHSSWKPKDHRRNLVRAAALIVAEIERLDRMDIDSDD